MSIFLSLIVLAIIATIMIVIGNKKETGKKTKRIIAPKSVKPIQVKESTKPFRIKTESKRTDEQAISWNKAFLKSLEWKRYEEVCMEYLRIKNCNANVTCTGADGGVDLRICDKNGRLLAIGQCKAWNKPIGVNLIRELYGIMAAEQVRHGIFLTTSIYSPDAIEFAKHRKLILIDADEFVDLINGLDEISKRRIDGIATEGDYSTPTCVHCNVKMIKRVIKRGINVGNEFWGCINYPKCKVTMHVNSYHRSKN
ncbi:MAG: restriction endonuclease [Methylococcales bacterium]|nr:restriction endonuclease [Methylococcales bacterium]